MSDYGRCDDCESNDWQPVEGQPEYLVCTVCGATRKRPQTFRITRRADALVADHDEIRRLRAALAMSRAEADDLRSARNRWIAEHDEVQGNLDIVREANAEQGAGLERLFTALSSVEDAYRTFVEAHGPLVDYSTSAEMVDFEHALLSAAAAVSIHLPKAANQ